MKKIRIGILGASEIAFRRFLPALKKDDRFEYVGLAIYRPQDEEKAKLFKETFGGEIYHGFEEFINRPDIDALYVPQPPALHYTYGKQVLLAHKHLFMEKPFTTSLKESLELINLAKENDLSAIENYMFRFHKQISEFKKIISKGKIGEITHYDLKFSFPLRSQTDFRFVKELGGGAILDCGGYPIMLASILLGQGEQKFTPISKTYENGFEVDMHGSAKLENSSGVFATIYWGMNDEYNCSVKAYGKKGSLLASRVFTAPSDFDVNFLLEEGGKSEDINIGVDDAFLKSIDNFYQTIDNKQVREDNFSMILKQAEKIDIMKGFKG